jgi:bifunctional ADP-heptose synthase (sugar kinase/adenylyltransferase)
VDAAVVFDEDTPLALITQIQPDVLVKGADWAADDIVDATSSRRAGAGSSGCPSSGSSRRPHLIGRASARP